MGTTCVKWLEAVCAALIESHRAPSAERRGHDCASGAGASRPAIAA